MIPAVSSTSIASAIASNMCSATSRSTVLSPREHDRLAELPRHAVHRLSSLRAIVPTVTITGSTVRRRVMRESPCRLIFGTKSKSRRSVLASEWPFHSRLSRIGKAKIHARLHSCARSLTSYRVEGNAAVDAAINATSVAMARQNLRRARYKSSALEKISRKIMTRQSQASSNRSGIPLHRQNPPSEQLTR